MPRVTLCILLLFAFLASGYDGDWSACCPETCRCTNLTAACSGNQIDYNHAVSALPRYIENFTFTIIRPALRSVSVDLRGINRLVRLREIRIQSSDIYRCRVNAIDSSTLCKLKQLTTLAINVKVSHITSKALACLENLEVLDVRNSRLPQEDLSSLFSTRLSRGLTKLLVGNAYLSFLDKRDFNLAKNFSGLNIANLQVVDLSSNSITSLSMDFPWPLLMRKLETLDLSRNLLIFHGHHLSLLTEVTLLGLIYVTPLKEISLADQGVSLTKRNKRGLGEADVPAHHLREPSGALFQDSATLFSVLQKWNTFFVKPVQEVPLHVNWEDQHFKSVYDLENSTSVTNQANMSLLLTKLKKHLESVKLSQISPGCLLNTQIPVSRSLQVLNLSGTFNLVTPYVNPMIHVNVCVFPDNNVTKLDLSNNGLSECLDDTSFTNFSIVGLGHLQWLSLANNNLRVTNMKMLKHFSALQTFLFGGNNIQIQLDDTNELFKGLKNLREVDLSRNNITTIPSGEFAHLTKMEILDLSGNHLRALDLHLPSSPSFKLLNISHNQLRFLNTSVISQLEAYLKQGHPTPEVDLTGNPWIYGCDTLHFVIWIMTTKLILTGRHSKSLSCSQGVRPIPFVDVQVHQLYKECSRLTAWQTALIACSSTVCSFCILLFAVYFYRKRWRIRYFWYRRRLKRQQQHLNDQYEYDAYVAYSEANPVIRRWVIQATTQLEERRGLRLFVKLRDLPPGGFYLERVDDAMRKCRKTLLLLSPEFLISRICLYEAWSAHTSIVTKNRDAAILVKLAALPFDGITATLTSLMEMRECLEWTEDPVGQELFWNKLEDAILAASDNPTIE